MCVFYLIGFKETKKGSDHVTRQFVLAPLEASLSVGRQRFGQECRFLTTKSFRIDSVKTPFSWSCQSKSNVSPQQLSWK